jgi:hypothetical protein
MPRPKNSPNKLNAELKERLNSLLSEYFDKDGFSNDLQVMDAPQRAGIYIKLLDYALPKLRSVQSDVPLVDNRALIIVNNEATKQAIEKLSNPDN